MQQEIRVEMIFRGYIISNWYHTNKRNKFSQMNKVIVCKCVEYYNRKWKEQNEIFHSLKAKGIYD